MDEKLLLSEILAALLRIEKVLTKQTGRTALGALKTDLPLLLNGRHPKFWQDAEVRDLLTSLHRRVEIVEALNECRALFGNARTPSRSSLHRYWQQLDEIVRRAA